MASPTCETFHVQKCCERRESELQPISCAVSVDGQLFLGTATSLYWYTPRYDWESKVNISLPLGLSEYALAVYNKHLLLIGGTINRTITNQVFVCDIDSDIHVGKWLEFSSMCLRRRNPSATSNDDLLIVASGYGDRNVKLQSMEVYQSKGVWSVIDLPVVYSPGDLDLVILGQQFYCSGMTGILDFSSKPVRFFYSTSLTSLSGHQNRPNWNLIKRAPPYRITKFSNQIVSISDSASVVSYCPITRSWKVIFNVNIQASLIVSLSTEELLIIGRKDIHIMSRTARGKQQVEMPRSKSMLKCGQVKTEIVKAPQHPTLQCSSQLRKRGLESISDSKKLETTCTTYLQFSGLGLQQDTALGREVGRPHISAKRVQEVKSPRPTSVLKHGQVSREIVGSLHSRVHSRGIEVPAAKRLCVRDRQPVMPCISAVPFFDKPDNPRLLPLHVNKFTNSRQGTEEKASTSTQSHSKTLSANPLGMSASSKIKKCLSQKEVAPKLHELDLIEANGQKIYVIKTVASRWEDMALRLHFDGNDIKRVKRDCLHQTKDCCRLLFTEWLEGNHCTPLTWETVIKALEEAEFTELANSLLSCLN